jgi:hypothetical protein
MEILSLASKGTAGPDEERRVNPESTGVYPIFDSVPGVFLNVFLITGAAVWGVIIFGFTFRAFFKFVNAFLTDVLGILLEDDPK